MSSSPTQVAGKAAAPRVTNEEVRAVLHTHIRKTAKFIKFLDLCVHLFAWVAAMFGLWLLACVVDHWLIPLSSVGRWLVWTVAVVGTTWWMVTKLVPLVFRRINPAYAAKRIEHLLPEFKNGLISWLELDQMPENGVPRGIMSALTYRAARFIGGQDPSNTVDTSRLIKLIGVVLLLFTSLVLYTIVSPKSALDTGKRIAMPWRSIAAPSRVQILNVKPGSVELTQGKPLEVEVEVRGIRTQEPVQVRFTTTDGQLRDQRIDLTAVTEGFRYSGKLRTETTGVEHELDYWVEAGDATSGPYRVSLSPLPSVVLDQVELKFPAYTKIPDRKVSGGDFEAVEGTRAIIHALGNQRMSRGRLEINPEVDAAGDLLRADAVHELSVDDQQLTGTLLLKLNSEKENPTNLTYRLRGFNQRGDGNREPILHSMKVIADVGPEIKLVGPENRRLRVRPTKKFNLEVQANDPDFGLSQIDIEIRRSGLVVRKETLLKSDGAIGQQIKRLPIDMADFKLPEGTKLEVRATAYDNRHDPDSEKLAANLKESELLTLEVVGPDQDVAPDEEPAPADESTDGKSEKNQEAGNEASRSGSGAGNQPNNQGGAGDRDAPNDPNGSTNDAEPSPRQNSTPNPANPNGSRDQGEQAGAEGKEEGKQGKQEGGQGKQGDQSKSSDGKSSDGKQKSGQAGGEQRSDGKQDSQGANEQGDKSGTQPGSKFGGNESSDGSKQPDAGSGSSSKNSQANPSNSGKAENEPSNSLGSKSSSPSPNAAKSNSGEKGSSGDESNPADNGANETGASSGSGEGNKPSDGEAVKIVEEFMQKPKPSGNESGSNESGASESDGNSKSSDKAGTDSKNGNKQPGEKGATPKQNGSDKDEAQNTGAKNEGVKPTDPSGKGKSSEEKSQSNDKGSQEKSSEEKGSNGKEASDSNGDKNSDSNSPGDKNSNGQNSDQQGSQSKGSENKGSENKGSDGKGSEGKGSEGKGSEGKGSEGKGSEGKGSQGKGSEGKGSEGKGSEGKGSEGSDGKGADGSDGKGAESKGAESKGGDSKSAESKGADSKGADSKGAESKGAESKGAESKGAESKGAESKGEQSGAQSDQPSSGSEGGGKTNASKSGKSGTSGSGTGNGEGRGGKADAANEDYANRTTQMVLDYLNRQKDQPDPELLRELNWTEDDLRKFTERWNKARNLAVSPNPEDQKKWKEMLDDLGLNRQTVKPSAAGSIDDNFQQMRDSGNRTRPPENLRKQYEAFRRAFEKSGK